MRQFYDLFSLSRSLPEYLFSFFSSAFYDHKSNVHLDLNINYSKMTYCGENL